MRYSQKQVDFLRANYSSIGPYKCAIVIGVEQNTLYQKAHHLKLKAPGDGRFKPGMVNEKTLFKPGHVPFNKGRKMSDWADDVTIQKFKANTFKKGNLPHNTKEANAITIRKDNRGIPYKFIRLDKAKWLHYHRYVWEQVHGKIPHDMIVVFKTPDTLNCEIENLQLISKADNVRRNSIHRYPEEMRDVFKLLGKIKRKINQTN